MMYPLITEAEKRPFDSTCRNLYRFLQAVMKIAAEMGTKNEAPPFHLGDVSRTAWRARARPAIAAIRRKQCLEKAIAARCNPGKYLPGDRISLLLEIRHRGRHGGNATRERHWCYGKCG